MISNKNLGLCSKQDLHVKGVVHKITLPGCVVRETW